MNNLVLTKVALRYQALFLDISHEDINLRSDITPPVVAFVARMAEYGYCISEELLHALNMVSLEHLNEITSCIDEVMGVKLNWAPLVKGWNTPTGETRDDHFITLIANIFGEKVGLKGTTLPCGHLIPNGTFPLERYNGFVRAKKDEDFGRPVKFMVREAKTTGAYYIVEQKPRFATTMGSVVVDDHLRVLGASGKPIRGLYAAGEVINAMHGDDSSPGMNISWAFTSGKLSSEFMRGDMRK